MLLENSKIRTLSGELERKKNLLRALRASPQQSPDSFFQATASQLPPQDSPPARTHLGLDL